MVVSDLVAICAAIVATIAAFIQYFQYKISKNKLIIRFNDEITEKHNKVGLSIQNTSSHKININNIWFGYMWRNFLNPIKKNIDAVGVRAFILDGYDEVFVDEIEPGGFVYVEVSLSSSVSPRCGLIGRWGFLGRNVVVVDHSGSSVPEIVSL